MNITSIMPQDRAPRNAEPVAGDTVAPTADGSREHGHEHGHEHRHDDTAGGHPHDHTRDHHAGDGHDHGQAQVVPARLPFSLVRMSLAGRLAIAASIAALLWGVTFWATTPIGG